jgi:hypothetical protein
VREQQGEYRDREQEHGAGQCEERPPPPQDGAQSRAEWYAEDQGQGIADHDDRNSPSWPADVDQRHGGGDGHGEKAGVRQTAEGPGQDRDGVTGRDGEHGVAAG